MKLLIWLSLLSSVFLMSNVAATPNRIVSTNGALTEIIYALDAAEYLVGVDTTSTHPAAAQALPQVGDQRALSLEGIASLEPDLVITTQAAGPALVLQQLDALGIERLLLADDYSAAGALQRIHTLAELLKRPRQAADLVAHIETELAALDTVTAQLAKQPPVKVLFLLTHVNNSRLAAGRQTVANAMIHLAGGHNVVQGYNGYKPLTAEAAAVLNPDVIIAVGTQNTENLVTALAKDAALQSTSAMQHQRVHVFDSLYFLGFGPRFAQAARELATYLLAQP